MLQFYISQATGEKTVGYFPLNAWPRKGPEWVIHHAESFNDPSHPKTRITDASGNTYDLVKTYPTAPLSGLHWFIYHNSTSFPPL